MTNPVIKIFKNTSNVPKIILNKIVPAGDSYDVPQRYWADIKYNTDLIADINSGDITINDGTSDLSVADAISWVERWQLEQADKVTFDPSSSGLTSTNMQDVAEELYTLATTGGYYQYAEDETVSATTSSNYIQKLRLTTSSIAAGTYKISWSYEYMVTKSNKNGEFRVQVDDSIDIHEISPEIRGEDWFQSAGFKDLTLAQGIHTIDLDFRRVAPSVTIKINRARLTIQRVD